MLGRLLKKGSSSSLYASSQPSPTPEVLATTSTGLASANVPQNNGNSFEDGYTRETLYGSSDFKCLLPIQFNRTAFRIIVSQDGSNLRSKQVLYDSAYNGTPIARNQKSKLHHHASELHDYMFGCGIPANESHFSSKIHLIPSVSNKFTDIQYSVLVSKLFSLTDTVEDESDGSPSWCPQLSLDSSRVNAPPTNLPAFDYKPTKSHNLVHSRFAVAFIIPIESLENLPTVVFNNWEEITHFLIILQRLVTKKLVNLLNNAVRDLLSDCESCPYIINKRIQFPDLVLQQDSEVALQLKKLVRLVHYNTNVPRLASTNLLIRNSALKGDDSFHPIILNWAVELINWLEFKDGKTLQLANTYSANTLFHNSDDVMMSTTFLASLFAAIIPLKKLLSVKPLQKGENKDRRDVARVIIMTGNPVVAKKLVFILNGLIPDSRISVELEHCKDVSPPTRRLLEFDDHLRHNNYHSLPSPPEEVAITPQKTAGSTVHAMPIAIKSTPLSTTASSNNSGQSLSQSATSRGWEIPHKSNASISTTPLKSKVDNTTKTIPINVSRQSGSSETRRSLSRSTSMAYLSSSLSSTLSSSASHYSLSKIGGSFLDKWKGTLVAPMGSYFDHYPPEYDTHAGGGSLSKRNSTHFMRTPSPAIEHDSFSWHTQPSHRSSRKASMTETKNGDIGYELLRSTTGVYPACKARGKIPPYLLRQELNESRIKDRCRALMQTKFSISNYTSNTLEINGGNDKTERLNHNVPLLPVVAFADEFWPDFVLQSCPVSPKLESQITTAMKNDLLFYKNSCNYSAVTSRAILVSLRAKEIKCFEMKTVSGDGEAGVTPYKSSVKRVFTPQSNYGDRELIAKIETLFDRLTHLLQAHMNKKDVLSQELMQVILLLIDV